jgi:hypothetical protein
MNVWCIGTGGTCATSVMSHRLTPEWLVGWPNVSYQQLHIFVLRSPFGTLGECLTQTKYVILLYMNNPGIKFIFLCIQLFWPCATIYWHSELTKQKCFSSHSLFGISISRIDFQPYNAWGSEVVLLFTMTWYAVVDCCQWSIIFFVHVHMKQSYKCIRKAKWWYTLAVNMIL